MINAAETKRTFLGMPGYGKQTAAAGRGLWRARRDMSCVSVAYHHGSLLAANFNALWVRALNACHRGDPISYFAMLHDDIGPQDLWLDTLIETLEEHDLDVLGVPVPLKDSRGVTSLAIDGESTWRPKCRLTMSEVRSLPDVFTSEDVGGPLLLNTGCWVCRFDMSWATQVRFTINDRIVFNRTLDMYQAEVEPEDWYFSRLCHELGLKIGATTRVNLDHRGEIDFHSSQVWGKHYDAEYTKESPLPYVFPFDVDGWLQPEEGRHLNELARGKRVLEIGSYCGRSTICMAQSAKNVTSVDPHDGRGTQEPQLTHPKFLDNLVRYGVASKVSSHYAIDEATGKYDLVFIDGAHDYDSVQRDIADATERLADGGLIAFHDYRTEPGEHDGGWDEGVTKAIQEFARSGAEIVSQAKTVVVLRPPVLQPTEN